MKWVSLDIQTNNNKLKGNKTISYFNINKNNVTNCKYNQFRIRATEPIHSSKKDTGNRNFFPSYFMDIRFKVMKNKYVS